MRRDSSNTCNLRVAFEQHAVANVLVLTVLLVGFSGCHIPSLRPADSRAPLPGDFNGMLSEQSAAQIGIDEFFSDPVLTQLIAQGLTSSQELKIRNEEVRIAQNEVLARRGAYLPFAFLGGGGGFERNSLFTPLGAGEEQLISPDGPFPNPVPNVGLSADLFWQVDIWRQLRNARDAAIQRWVEAVERRDYFVTQLVAEIASSYYELAALDKRLEYLNQIIELQQQSLEVAKAQLQAARGTQLGVQRFLAEVRKNESQVLILRQQIIQVENRINVLVGRYPQFVDRESWDFIALDSRMLSVGVPAQLLLNRRDIRAAERELAASGLDVLVARADFFPKLVLTARVGTEGFDPGDLFDAQSLVANAAGELVGPLINRKAIRAEYQSANARQLQAVYDYQRTVIKAFTEVVNSMAKVQNYGRSVAIKQEQVQALEQSVDVASTLFRAPIEAEHARVEYVDVLLAQRDLLEARQVLIETKQQQLAAIVSAYQALGGGYLLSSSGKTFAELYCPPTETIPEEIPLPPPPADEPMPTPAAEPILPVPADKPMPPASAGEGRPSTSTDNPIPSTPAVITIPSTSIGEAIAPTTAVAKLPPTSAETATMPAK